MTSLVTSAWPSLQRTRSTILEPYDERIQARYLHRLERGR